MGKTLDVLYIAEENLKVQYIDRGVAYTGVCICHNGTNCILRVSALLCRKIIPQ